MRAGGPTGCHDAVTQARLGTIPWCCCADCLCALCPVHPQVAEIISDVREPITEASPPLDEAQERQKQIKVRREASQ